MKVYLFGIALLSLQATAGQIYQCGSSFQDTPCATDKPGKVVGNYEVIPQTPEEIKANQDKIQAMADKLKAQEDAELEEAAKARQKMVKHATYLSAIGRHEIMMGMTSDDLIKSWGEPADINETVTNAGSSQQWVYVTPSGRQYVYVTNGVITGWN